MTWFHIQRDGNRAKLHLGDAIGFGCSEVSELIAELQGATEIELFVNSHGGCARTGDAVFEALKGRTPRATIVGVACSAAAMIVHAADKIIMRADAKLMLHAPSVSEFATAEGLRQTAAWLEQFTAARVDRLCDRGAKLEDACRWLSGPDFWFTAPEALAAGLIDEIEPVPRKSRVSRLSAVGDFPSIEAEAHAEEELLLDLLRALGTIRTADKKKLAKNLSAWFAGVQEVNTL